MLWWQLRKLRSVKSRERLDAVKRLGDHNDPRSIEALVAVANGNAYSDERRAAIDSLGRLRAAAAVPTILKLLGDYSFTDHCERALLSIGPIATTALADLFTADKTALGLRRRLLNLLRKLSWHPTSGLEVSWVGALDGKYAESLRDRASGQKVLLTLLREGSAGEIGPIASALLRGTAGTGLNATIADTISGRIKDLRGHERWISTIVLAELSDKRAIALLKGFLFTDGGKYWAETLKRLAGLGCDPIAEVLDATKYISYDDRKTANELLASTGDLRVLTALVKAIPNGYGEEAERAKEFVRVNAIRLPQSTVHELIEFLIPVLERGERGVRFVSSAGVWELLTEGSGAHWSPSRSDLDEAITGLVTWRRVRGGRGVEPFLGSALLRDWWSTDRFSWDRVLAVGALDKGAVVLVTPLGPLIRRLSQSGSIPEELWLQTGLSSCSPARRDGVIIGMLIGGRLLVDSAPDGTPQKKSATVDLDLEPHLVLNWVDDPNLGRRIDFHEEWRRRGAGHPLESRIPTLPSERLLQNGQFAFERVASIGMISDDQWAASAGCDSVSCLGALYQRTGETLRLRDLVRLPAHIGSIRGSSAGGLFGRAGDNVDGFFALFGDNGSLRAARVSATDAGDAFYEGDSVSLKLPSLNWEAAKRYQASSRAFSLSPSGYALVKPYESGVAFSFDILRSVAAMPEWRKVALASEGGMFLCTAHTGTLDLSIEGGCNLSLESEGLSLGGVARVRASNGKLWVVYSEGDRVAVYNGERWSTTLERPPWQRVATVAGMVTLEKEGIRIAEMDYSRSNDAWGIGVRPLDGIIEMVYHPASKFAWLCSRENGVFKLRLAGLPGQRSGR